MKGRKTTKRIRKAKSFDWNKFVRKGIIRLAYRAIEMSILLAIGAALGFKLIRY